MDASQEDIPIPCATGWVFHSSGARAGGDDDVCFPLCAKCAEDAKGWDWSDAKDGKVKIVPITFDNRGLKDAMEDAVRLLECYEHSE